MVIAASGVKQIQVHNEPNFSIYIKHIPTAKEITFDGWVTNFSDAFQSTWSGTPVYGRMDDLYTFQRTGRKISIQFDVLSTDQGQAAANQANLNRLTQFLYPVYTEEEKECGTRGRHERVIAAPPLLKMRWANLMENSQDMSGLVGFLQGFTYTPTMEAGQFFSLAHPALNRANTDEGEVDETVQESLEQAGQGRVLNYQHYSVQLEFTVLHTHLTGWSKDKAGNFIFGGSESDGDMVGFPHRAGHGGHAMASANPLVQAPEPKTTSEVANVETDPEQQAEQCEVLS